MIFVVLGMHKSGTTLISQILHSSGIDMGSFDPSQSYDQGNQYERSETLELNMNILGYSFDVHSLDVITPISDLKIGDAKWDGEINDIIRSNDSKYANWGFKDPRTCLTYPLWKKQLQGHKIVAVFRNPLELWYHYTKKISWFHGVRKIKYGFKSLKTWYIYNNEMLRYLEEDVPPSDSISFEFAEFMISDGPFEKLQAFTNIELHDSRRKDLYRSKGRTSLAYLACKKALAVLFAMNVDDLFSRLRKTVDESGAVDNTRNPGSIAVAEKEIP